MVDLSKHLQRARQSLERRNYDLALAVCIECQEVDPTNLENYRIFLEAARKRAQEKGGSSFMAAISGFTFSGDPQKKLTAAVKRVSKSPDLKALKGAGDAARKVAESGVKALTEVAILFYEEGRSGGLFNVDLLWNLGHSYHDKFLMAKEREPLEKAIACMYEIEKGQPAHPEAPRRAKDWEAEMSMARRSEGKSGDYRSQLASDEGARRNEVMNRMIRTEEDAREVLAFVERDLEENPGDKQMWVKKGDVHRRVDQFEQALSAYQEAAKLDEHDFSIVVRMGDARIGMLQVRLRDLKARGEDPTAVAQELLELEISEYRMRCERQPTDMSHQFNLGTKLYDKQDVDAAAAAFQKAVNDPRYKRQSHFYLGHCFTAKNLLDLAIQQYTSCLSLIEDDLGAQAKEVRYSRARAYESRGNKEEACTDYLRLVEIDLSYKDAAQRLDQLRSS